MERAAVSRKPNIGIRELKENLSAVVDSAWEHPVSVHRYGSPWVWIVSHEVWTRNTRRIDFNPAGHPLAAVRQHLDMAMRERQPRLHAAALRAMLRIEAQPLLRALAVQLLYGLETEAALHEQISCNLLFRWFVGLSLTSRSGRRRNLDIRWSACWPAPSLWPSWRNCCSARRWRRSRRLPAFR